MSWRKWLASLLGPEEDPSNDELIDPEAMVVFPIEDRIDLHAFQPKEVRPLLEDYLEAACSKGFREVLVIHGKGTGVLARQVHSLLMRHPRVVSFRQAEDSRGGWGATVVVLQCPPPE